MVSSPGCYVYMATSYGLVANFEHSKFRAYVEGEARK
jgi:hypothetical protein